MEVQDAASAAASRLRACPRLSRVRETERQRAIQQPLTVAWRETREDDGRVYISISSSEEEEESEEESTPPTQKGEPVRNGLTRKPRTYAPRANNARAGPSANGRGRDERREMPRSTARSAMTKQEPEAPEPIIYTIDSDSDDDVESDDVEVETNRTAAEDNVKQESEVVLLDEEEGEEDEKEEEEEEYVDEEEQKEQQQQSVETYFHEQQERDLKSPVELSPIELAAWSPAGVSPPPRRRHPPPQPRSRRYTQPLVACGPHGVYKRRLEEEDAAFLLFYGERDSPGADVLRLLVDLISTGVGARDSHLSTCIKYVLWNRLDAAVEDGLASERLVQAEWTKIVFSCRPPRHRRRSGPMSRAPLLPRPVTITVRPLQFSRKQPRRHNLRVSSSNGNGNGENGDEEEDEMSFIEQAVPIQNHGMSTPRGIKAVEPVKRPSSKRLVQSAKQIPRKLPPISPRKRPRAGPVLDDEVEIVGNGYHKSKDFSPRKTRRRNGTVGTAPVTPRQVTSARGRGGQNIGRELMEPLPFDCWTLGENRSLPVGWKGPQHGAMEGYRKGESDAMPPLSVAPVEVNPLLQMTADEILQHINSVRREGRFTSFEKVTDILLKLMGNPRNRHGVFNSPVDPEALNLPTYRDVVTHPMDLGTVKHKLELGEYLELQDFVADVHLVFDNAMRFNPPIHYIYVDAELLRKRFDDDVRREQTRQAKRQRSLHPCLVCRGKTCIVCEQQCLSVEQPRVQCSGSCGADIRKGVVYYVTRDGTRVWCQKCRNRLVKERNAIGNSGRTGENNADLDPVTALVKKKCEPSVEPWVKCGECERWLHQICGLYNPVVGAYGCTQPHDGHTTDTVIQSNGNSTGAMYVCPLCRLRRKRVTPPPESPMRHILNADPDENARGSSCMNIPCCELSLFIQDSLRRGLREIGEDEAADTLHVRALSFPGERMVVPEGVASTFAKNSQLLEQVQPEADTAKQHVPTHISYLSRGLYLFQKHEGMEVCLFTLFAQEFGDNCELESNRRAVYIAYLDSVRYLKPASARTAAYHLMMLAYFDYLRRHGFSRVHIWSCPPQKRISYVFWCRPPFQKTPSAEHLRHWYNKLLVKAQACGIVKSWTNLYDRYFSGKDVGPVHAVHDNDAPVSFVSVKEEGTTSRGVATRRNTVQSVDPGSLTWPASRLPPIFDGDIIPSELERILGAIVARNNKQSRASRNKQNAAARGKNSQCARSGGKRAVGDAMVRIKEESTGTEPPSGPVLPQVDVTLREMFAKCQTAVQRLKNDLLVVDLQMETEGSAGNSLVCRPEALVPSWCDQVPRLFGSRFMFHQLCSYAGYQFDSLRRAKHSTMMMLHHYFNERVAQLNVFCRECNLLITRADFWACRQCERYALCDSCHQRLGGDHPHALVFGPAPLPIPPRPPPLAKQQGVLGPGQPAEPPSLAWPHFPQDQQEWSAAP